MRSSRTLIVLTLALCAISARAQDPAANNQQQGSLLNYLQNLPAGFDLNQLRPQAVHDKVTQGASAIQGAKQDAINHVLQSGTGLVQNGVDAAQNLGQAGINAAQNIGQAGVNAAQSLGKAGLNTLQQAGSAYGSAVNNVADHVSNTAAGTVRTVGTVANGVGGAIGTVSDVVAQTIKDIPSDIRGSLSDTREALTQDFQTARQAAGMLGQFAQNAVPIIPPITKMWNPAAWREQYKAYGTQFDNAYDILEDTFENIAQGISARYCTEAEYIPKTKKPAKFTGPGFSITFLTGECAINETSLLFNKTKQINCIKPSVVYEKTPAKFVSKYKSAPKFIGKECKITKKFGEEITKVLYVFDGSDNLPLANLTRRITSEVQGVLNGARAGTGAVTQQLQTFLASMPQLGHGLYDGKIGKVDLIPNFDLSSLNLPNIGGGLGSLAGLGGNRGVQTPPVQAEGTADPYEQLKAALSTYHTQ